MDTPLSPRDIQTRIRGGESLEDLTDGAGDDAGRIERFAAPVLAEREHLALTALGSSVRRRGEASGHRPLRAVVAERLLGQGVDADDVGWDAWKRDDHHWQVVADYELQGEPRHAEFRFDTQGRFSVAEDDEARWLAGESPSPVAASVDRDDELALVRATREPSGEEGERASAAAEELLGTLATLDVAELLEAEVEADDQLGAVLQVVPPAELSEEELAQLAAHDPESDPENDPAQAPDRAVDRDSGTDRTGPTPVERRDEAAEPTVAVVRHLSTVTVDVEVSAELDVDLDGRSSPEEVRSALDTLYDMLGGDGYAEDSPRVYRGLSDAAAVPVVDEHDFEPTSHLRVPAEPDAEEADADADPDEAAALATAPTQDAIAPVPEALAVERAPEPAPTSELPPTDADRTDPEPDADPEAADDAQPDLDPDVDPAPARPSAVDELPEPLVPSPGASRKPGRRKRASVPSWDEIMFGGPKPG